MTTGIDPVDLEAIAITNWPTPDELAKEIFVWAENTFPERTDSSMFLKMYSETAELIRSGGDPLEFADLVILLFDYAVRKDINITEAVRQKLEINRRRTWVIGSDGTMSHKENSHE